MSAARTYIRQQDIRLELPTDRGVDESEALYSLGRYFQADCLETDLEGACVRVYQDSLAGYYQVTSVDVTDLAQMPAMGVIVAKEAPTRCFVQRAGIVTAEGLVPGRVYFVGLDAQLAVAPPTAPLSGYAVTQEVGYALSSTDLVLQFSSIRIKRGANA